MESARGACGAALRHLRHQRVALPARVDLGRREMSLLCRQQVSVGQRFFASHDWRTGSAKRAGKMAQPCKWRNAWPICLAPIGVSLIVLHAILNNLYSLQRSQLHATLFFVYYMQGYKTLKASEYYFILCLLHA